MADDGTALTHAHAVLWRAIVSAPDRLDEVLALLGVGRDGALAMVDRACRLDPDSGVPEAIVAEASARWGGDRRGCERAADVAEEALLDLVPYDDATRARLLRNARAGLARHRKALAAEAR